VITFTQFQVVRCSDDPDSWKFYGLDDEGRLWEGEYMHGGDTLVWGLMQMPSREAMPKMT